MEDLSFTEMLMKDNEVLSRWVGGLLEGCEGCKEEATSWAKAQQSRPHVLAGGES